MNEQIERLKQANKDNQRMITVNAGVIKAAIREIKAHVSVNGKGIMTDAVINALEAAIK